MSVLFIYIYVYETFLVGHIFSAAMSPVNEYIIFLLPDLNISFVSHWTVISKRATVIDQWEW